MSTTTQTAYAVIESAGRHSSGAIVRPIRVSASLEAARKAAAKATRDYQDAMRAHGGTSGGYVVVEAPAGRKSSWLGHDADRLPRL